MVHDLSSYYLRSFRVPVDITFLLFFIYIFPFFLSSFFDGYDPTGDFDIFIFDPRVSHASDVHVRSFHR